MTNITRRAALALGVALGLSACLPFGSDSNTATPSALPEGSRLVLVRHMDRDNGNLSGLGQRRAEELVDAIADVPLDAIYTHELRRNVDSTTPLAQARGIEMTLIDPDTSPETLPGLASGRSIIWVGNTGNLGRIWDALSLPGEPPLTYGTLAIIEARQDGLLTVENRRFGPRPVAE